MVCAKALADAETLAEELDITVTWRYEEEDWMSFCWMTEDRKRYERNFESGKWEVFYAFVNGEYGYLACLGGIVLGPDNRAYRRVIEAELKAEAIAELMKHGEVCL